MSDFGSFGNSRAAAVSIRRARTNEQKMLESVQRRASLSNPGDRDALLANPKAIAVPLEQLAEGCVFVAERDGVVVGFAARCQDRPGTGGQLRQICCLREYPWRRISLGAGMLIRRYRDRSQHGGRNALVTSQSGV
jgi:hypothetical protein